MISQKINLYKINSPPKSSNYNNQNHNKIYFNYYRLDSLIGKGTFGLCYKGTNIRNNEEICLKIEPKNSPKKLLENESLILSELKGSKGIPEFFLYGISDCQNVLIMELLSENLQCLFEKNSYYFSIKSICLMTIQIVSNLKQIYKYKLFFIFSYIDLNIYIRKIISIEILSPKILCSEKMKTKMFYI